MTAETKAPVRIFTSRRESEIGTFLVKKIGPYDQPYILESALPGTLEQIEKVICLADELQDDLSSLGMGPGDRHGDLVADLGRALAALRQKERPDAAE